MLSYIKDRFLRLRLERDEREIKIGFTVSGLIIIALIVNIVYLNFFIIKSSSIEPSSQAPAVILSPTPTSQPTLAPVQTSEKSSARSETTSTKLKDYYINLGSGVNQSTDWADVAGTLTTFDLGQYQNIKDVRLETTINVPTANGTISVRLFNKTDGYAVWNSERTVQAQANGELLISQSIIYDVGARLYQVQMKSQLNAPANLLQARLHVVAE